MSRSPRLRAFTLVEVLVASAILLLVLGVVTRFMQSAYRISHEEFERNGVEEVLLSLTTRLSGDFAEAAPAGISLSTGGSDLLINPVFLTDTGTVVYQKKYVLWHLDPGSRLLTRRESKSVPGVTYDGTPFRAEESVLLTLYRAPEFKLADQYPKVSEFSVADPAGVSVPFVGSPLRLKVSLDLDLARTRQKVQVERVFHLRNSGI